MDNNVVNVRIDNRQDKSDVAWQRIIKTLVLNATFISFGVLESSKGPTLLDFRDLLQTTLPTITLIFIIRSVGSIIGSFGSGFLLDKFIGQRYILLFVFMLAMSLANAILPFSGHLPFFFFLIFICGFTTGAVDSGGNVLCLDIWRGHGGDHWMHSIHFSFAFGAFLGPVVAKPFLSAEDKLIDATTAADIQNNPLLSNTINETMSAAAITTTNNTAATIDEEFGIKIMYPILGAVSSILALGHLAFAILSRKHPEQYQELVKQTDENQNGHTANDEAANGKAIKILFVSLMIAHFFFYVGMEVNYGTYITTFAVECQLQLTKQEGATITAIFWGSFAVSRFVSIFVSFKVKPLHMLVFAFGLCLGGSIVLAIYGDSSVILLKICSGLMGIGMGPTFACAMLWTEEHVIVTPHMGSALIIAAGIGADAFPIFIGQFISKLPMMLMYLQVAVVLSCISMFLAALSLTRKLPPKPVQPPIITSADKIGFELQDSSFEKVNI